MYELLVQNLAKVQFRRETLNGRNHLVVPMTMIVPGVLKGSKGSLFYPPDEVGKDPTPWNGMPITVYHPVRNGKNVSARDKEVLDTQGIGIVLKARTGDRLRAEAWIDEDKANKVDPRVIDNIQKGNPVEISTGLFTDNTPAPEGSNHYGKPYHYIARNYRPDHLAILPDQKGACSVNDGCGLGINANPEGKNQYTGGVALPHLHSQLKQAVKEHSQDMGIALVKHVREDSRFKDVSKDHFDKAMVDLAKGQHIVMSKQYVAGAHVPEHEKAHLVQDKSGNHYNAVSVWNQDPTANDWAKWNDSRKSGGGYSNRGVLPKNSAGARRAIETRQAKGLADKPAAKRVVDKGTVNKIQQRQKAMDMTNHLASKKGADRAAAQDKINKALKAGNKGAALSHAVSYSNSRASEHSKAAEMHRQAGNHKQAAIHEAKAAFYNAHVSKLMKPSKTPLHNQYLSSGDRKFVLNYLATNDTSMSVMPAAPKKKKKKGLVVSKKTATTNAMEIKDHEKSARRLSQHAVELSKTSSGYEDGISGCCDDAMEAVKGKDHEGAADAHHKAIEAHADAIDEDDSEEIGTHVKAIQAHTTAAASHYDVAKLKHEASVAKEEDNDADEGLEMGANVEYIDEKDFDISTLNVGESFERVLVDNEIKWKIARNSDPEDEDDDDDDLDFNSEFPTSTSECKAKTERANSASELADKSDRPRDHNNASYAHDYAADAWMNHEKGPNTDKAAEHSKKAAEHKAKSGQPMFNEESVENGGPGSGPHKNGTLKVLGLDKPLPLNKNHYAHSSHASSHVAYHPESGKLMAKDKGPEGLKRVQAYAGDKQGKMLGLKVSKAGEARQGPTHNQEDIDVDVNEEVLNNEGEEMAKLTANERSAIILALTTNGCGCYQPEDKETLEGYSDERLTKLKTNAAEHLTANSSGSEKKEMTDDEWMKQCPPKYREAVTNAALIVENEKQGIITKLVANFDDAKKKSMTEMLSAKSLDEVKLFAEFQQAVPAQNQQQQGQNRLNVYGPLGNAVPIEGSIVQNDANDVELMKPKTTNWKEMSDMFNGKTKSSKN